MDNDAMIEKLKKQKGREGELAKVMVTCKQSGWYERQAAQDEFARLLTQGSPKSLAEVFDNGPRKLFVAIHGKKAADSVGEITRQMNLYVHFPSSYRRSFRTKEVKSYMERLITGVLDCMFFSWEDFDIVKDLTSPHGVGGADGVQQLSAHSSLLYGDVLAL